MEMISALEVCCRNFRRRFLFHLLRHHFFAKFVKIIIDYHGSNDIPRTLRLDDNSGALKGSCLLFNILKYFLPVYGANQDVAVLCQITAALQPL
ncbi:MAG: hypothetical protein LUE29_07590 [Lachnospiraceae bacterium]|nr:hypothetical protein [Lachnospiraceae bacterium]